MAESFGLMFELFEEVLAEPMTKQFYSFWWPDSSSEKNTFAQRIFTK